MKLQIRGMLAAGLSGFPFWAHDAGGFHTMPSDAMYRQWSIAMGSFSPMWKPHGIGLRFPWLFSQQAQSDFKSFGALRMRLLPYLYTAAWRAATTGTPIARAMIFEHRTEPDAWKADQQYMWGDAFLVAPVTADGGGSVNVWLPTGSWYDFSDDTKLSGGKTLTYAAPTGKLPLFVKAGAIVFGAEPSLSTKTWDRSKRVLDVYTGADGAATQFEDDGVSDAYQTGGRALTKMTFANSDVRLVIAADDGTYAGAPATRAYHVALHGLDAARNMQVNGVPANAQWDAQKHVLSLDTGPLPVNAQVVIEPLGAGGPGVDGGTGEGGAGGPGDQPPGGSGAGGSGGCGCRASRADGSAALGTFLVVLGLAARRRRR
jgi:alpha-D-xyloside xylohydrolase